jgi:hypothetical protein
MLLNEIKRNRNVISLMPGRGAVHAPDRRVPATDLYTVDLSGRRLGPGRSSPPAAT